MAAIIGCAVPPSMSGPPRPAGLLLGNNTNLVQHVLGQSLYQKDTPLGSIVSFSESEEWVRLPNQPITEFWVYEVSPDRNFYSVVYSPQHALSRARPGERVALESYLKKFGSQREWSSIGGVPVNRITRATRYVFDSGQGDFVAREERRNPAVSAPPQAAPNSNPYPVVLTPIPDAALAVEAESGLCSRLRHCLESLGLTCLGVRSDRGRQSAAAVRGSACASSPDVEPVPLGEGS